MANYDSLLFVGTYTSISDSEGIYAFNMDSKTAECELAGIMVSDTDPTTHTFIPEKDLLVVANEDQKKPHFSTFSINRETGSLKMISKLEVPGSGTCHIGLSADKQWVFGANYYSGNIVWAKINDNGELIGPSKTIWYKGKSIKQRQDKSYLHGTTFIDSCLFAMDLGADKIYAYDFDSKKGTLVERKTQPVIDVRKGEGPRHLLVHPNKKWAYLITELGNSVVFYDINEKNELTEKQIVALLPKNYTGECRASVMQIPYSGKYLFAATRDYDSLVRFTIDEKTGQLSDRLEIDCHGEHPRTFMFTEDNEFILICNQFSNKVTICKYDKDAELPGDIVCELDVPGASCAGIIKKN